MSHVNLPEMAARLRAEAESLAPEKEKLHAAYLEACASAARGEKKYLDLDKLFQGLLRAARCIEETIAE